MHPLTVVALVVLCAFAVILGCSASRVQYAKSSEAARPATVSGWAPPAALDARAARKVAPAPTGHHASGVNMTLFPAGSLPSLHEEVWVIERGPVGRKRADDVPGTGSIVAVREGKEVPIPLEHTDVKAAVDGYIATVDVTQRFHNPFDAKIEAVYVFPLPQNAAVTDFIMVIGERRIRGIVRERAEARRIYADAKRQGYVATLLTQERANVFTQRVANIEPKKRIDVAITYFQTLPWRDGAYEFVFPMVVGPRFNPPGTTEGIGAVRHGRAGRQKTNVTYLPPGTRSGHDISLKVDLNAGVAIRSVACPTHAVTKTTSAAERVGITLSPHDAIPNRDFVLRWNVSAAAVTSTLMTHRDARGGYFTLMLMPPEHLDRAARRPMEFIFVIDTSGSMAGWPLEKAQTATERALRMLGPTDTFQIITFCDRTRRFAPTPLPATAANVRRGLAYVRALRAEGGTVMLDGMRAALEAPAPGERLRIVTFMTDGFIGNESDVLTEVHHRVGTTRIFSFGVGTSPNRYLMERMAKLGRGAVAYIGSASTPTDAVDRFYERAAHPSMSGIRIDWGEMRVSEVYPSRIGDLFVGRPVILTGRFAGDATGPIRITGNLGSTPRTLVVHPRRATKHAGLPTVWARLKIAELADSSMLTSDGEIPQAIRGVALEYGLMSAYTSFIAVDATRRTTGDHGTTVDVPVPVPHGTRYETTVEN